MKNMALQSEATTNVIMPVHPSNHGNKLNGINARE
jgi:hypothetical protein